MRAVMRTGAALLVGAAVGWSMGRGSNVVAEGPTTSPVRPIRTDELQLVDKTGKIRATLGFLYGRDSDERTPKLRLYDHESNQLTEIDPNGVLVKSMEGRSKLRLSMYPRPGITIYDSKGDTKAHFQDGEKGPELVLIDAKGERVRYPR